ncbi:hypothetical protein [Candidatus Kuenenia sp.]|uniref:hypothetical protein n=1 Tax=Candidatus Kuenenia sp. TaxID=2499824 RepID=UPI00321FE9B2
MEDEKEEEKNIQYCSRGERLISCYIGPCGSLFVATAILVSAYLGSNYLKERAAAKALTERGVLTMEAIQVYSGIMRKQEEAENKLREYLFNSSIKIFSEADTFKLNEQMLNFELIANNFHESFNLKPFFEYMKEKMSVSSLSDSMHKEYLTRLYQTAQIIIEKQMLILEGAGDKFSRIVDIERLEQSHGSLQLEEDSLIVEGIERNYKTSVIKVNIESKEILLRLEVRTIKENATEVDKKTTEFWVSLFDFPMIHNVTLSYDQRCAIVLNEFTESCADITLATFPGSLASRGKPYYQETIQNLLATGKLFDEDSDKTKQW